jgi:ABC-2 type transport system ATP-binding protein
MNSPVLVQKARKVYPGGTEALKGVDLEITEGEAVGLIGPNGAGKTTLVKLVLGLLRPTSGHVQVWGEDAYSLSNPLRGRMGFLLEEQGIYGSLTVEENLLFWARVYGVEPTRIEKLLREWDLEEKRKAPAKELSAGMRQKLAIVRTLLHDPSLLVLDEPTSNLDPAARKNVVDLLWSYTGQGKALLITSHDLFDIERICTRIVLLRRGRIAAQGTMNELRTQLGVGREVRIAVSQPIPVPLMKGLVVQYGAKPLGERELLVSDEEMDTRSLVRELVEQGFDVDRVEERRVTLEDLYTTIVKEDEER